MHAAAIRKARSSGDDWLVDHIYSGVPASWLGREQEIEVGPMSGAANVLSFLERHGLPPRKDTVARVLAAAKRSNRTLEQAELLELVDDLVPEGDRSR